MKPEQIEEMLGKYRVQKARYALLRSRLDELERILRVCENSMVSDLISLSQAITGMPHGSSVGDPTGRLAINLTTGTVSDFVKQVREEIMVVTQEAARLMEDLRVADIVISAMTEREREVIEMKIMSGMDWGEVLSEMNRRHSNSYSKRTLQRLYSRAIERAEEVTK